MQLEFGFLLGPPDGRYLTRAEPDGPTEAVLVLSTLGSPERRRLGGRRARAIEEAEPTPVPTSRATVVRPEPFDSRAGASAWLAALRDDREAALAERERRGPGAQPRAAGRSGRPAQIPTSPTCRASAP